MMESSIKIHKSYLILVLVVLMLATASSTIDFKDTDINFHNAINMNGNQIKDIGNPSDPKDAVTLEWVQNNIGGSGSGVSSGSPIYGDGSDGEIVDYNDNRDGIYYTERYVVPSGQTVSTSGLFIHAEDEIVIQGEIDAEGGGGEGGDMKASAAGGDIAPEDGISGGGGKGGEAGGENTFGAQEGGEKLGGFKNMETPISPDFRKLYDLPDGGAGGGGGGCAMIDRGSTNADDCGPKGGNGGGLVVLMAPSIEIQGSIDVSGAEGKDGNRCKDGENREDFAEPGSGGGSGGTVVLASKSVSGSGNVILAGGEGGEGADCTLGDNDIDDNWDFDRIQSTPGYETYSLSGGKGEKGSNGRLICYDSDSSIC